MDQWELNSRNTYTYDGQGNKLTDLEEQPKMFGWKALSRKTYTYDGMSNMLLDLEEKWQDNQWVDSLRKIFTYNNDGNMITGLIERYVDSNWTLYNRYFSIGTYYYPRCAKIEVTWTSITTGISENKETHYIQFSPNPATDYIYINVGNTHAYSLQQEINIYNSLGECVMHLTPAISEGEGARIDVSQLFNGIYFIKFANYTFNFRVWR
jgi:hypothetical protein